jgi:uncharacterized protein with PIN domain
MVCNGILESIAQKEDIRDSVPEFIYLTVHDFVKCTGCSRIYWSGSHHKRIREKIMSIFHDYEGPLYTAEEGAGSED